MFCPPSCSTQRGCRTDSDDDNSDNSSDAPAWVENWLVSPARSPPSHSADDDATLYCSPVEDASSTPSNDMTESSEGHLASTPPARACALDSTCSGNTSLLHLLPMVCECGTTLRKVCRFYMQLNTYFRHQAEEHARECDGLAVRHQRQISGLLQLTRTSPELVSIITSNISFMGSNRSHLVGSGANNADHYYNIYDDKCAYFPEVRYSGEDIALLGTPLMQPTLRRLRREMASLRDRCRVHAMALESELQVSMRAAILTALHTHHQTHHATHCAAAVPADVGDNLSKLAEHTSDTSEGKVRSATLMLQCIAAPNADTADGGSCHVSSSVSLAFGLSPLSMLRSSLRACSDGLASQEAVEAAVMGHLTRLAQARHAMLVIFGTREQAGALVELPHTPELLLGTPSVSCVPHPRSHTDGTDDSHQTHTRGSDAVTENSAECCKSDIFQPLPKHLYRAVFDENESDSDSGASNTGWTLYVSCTTRLWGANILLVCEPHSPTCTDDNTAKLASAHPARHAKQDHIPACDVGGNEWTERCNALSTPFADRTRTAGRQNNERQYSTSPSDRSCSASGSVLDSPSAVTSIPVSILSAVLNLAASWQVDMLSVAVLDASQGSGTEPPTRGRGETMTQRIAPEGTPTTRKYRAENRPESNNTKQRSTSALFDNTDDNSARVATASMRPADCHWCAPVLRALHQALCLFMRRRNEGEECFVLGPDAGTPFDDEWLDEEQSVVYAGRLDPTWFTRGDVMSVLTSHSLVTWSGVTHRYGARTAPTASYLNTSHDLPDSMNRDEAGGSGMRGSVTHPPTMDDCAAGRSRSRSMRTENDKSVVAHLRQRLFGCATARPKLLQNIVSQGSKTAHSRMSQEQMRIHDNRMTTAAAAKVGTKATPTLTTASSSLLYGLPFAIQVFVPISPHAFASNSLCVTGSAPPAAATGSSSRPSWNRVRDVGARHVDIPLATPAGFFRSPFALLRRRTTRSEGTQRSEQKRPGNIPVSPTRLHEREAVVLRDILNTAFGSEQNYRVSRVPLE